MKYPDSAARDKLENKKNRHYVDRGRKVQTKADRKWLQISTRKACEARQGVQINDNNGQKLQSRLCTKLELIIRIYYDVV